ncbi:MAG: acetate/propionate family kinase [Candidatus Sumerlaeaceae bacterium]|jgi:acetate kinase
MKVLVLNVGSSSVKFELIDTSLEAIQAGTERKLGRGLVDKIGATTSTVRFQAPGKEVFKDELNIADHAAAIKQVLVCLTHPETGAIGDVKEIEAVGHRVVHGGEYFTQSMLLDDEALERIKECFELAPLHNPHNYRGIRLMQQALPDVPHVAVFDTSFHQTMPKYAFIYALPYEVYQKYKIRRYGFHGTSHRYMTYAIETRFAKRPRKEFKAITVHLGNGCSIAAVDGGRSIDTSMGFTPLEGLIMGTRCGDIDPAIILYLMAKEDQSVQEMNTVLNKFSGLKGISGLSNDMRELVAAMQEGNERATLAVKAFCYRVRKYIGAYHAALGGADYIAFAGGIGENSALVRELILENLEKVGIVLDRGKNNSVGARGGEITADNSPVRAFVIPTDEELVIARDTVRAIAGVLS